MVEEIKKEILKIAETNDFEVSNNIDKIINAKLRFFGEDEWRRCPCDRDNNGRFCCSTQCQKDVRETGACHCNLFKRKA